MQLLFFSASFVSEFLGFLFLDHTFTHTSLPLANDVRLCKFYAFQSAGGSPVLTVNFISTVCFFILVSEHVFLFLVWWTIKKTNAAQAMRWKKGTIMYKNVREFEV